MRRLLLLAAVTVLAAVVVSPLLADDFMPPDFRGDPLTYLAVWEFTNPPVNQYDIDPDFVTDVGDGYHSLFSAYTHVNYDNATLFWDPTGFIYTTDQPSQIDVELNNWIDDYQFKHVWIQITYSGQGMPTVVDVRGADSSEQWSDPYPGQFVHQIDFDPSHAMDYWIIQPNPNMESILIDIPPFTSIDEIVVDTWSTDEPVGNEQRSWSDVKTLFR